MKKIFLYLVVMSAVVACDPAKLERDSFSMITETISGIYCPATKATIAGTDASFKWSVGDNIAVHVSNGDNHKYVFTSGNGGASVAEAEASFSVTYESGYSRDAFAVFPSSIVSATATNYGQSGSPLDVTLPARYTLSQVQGEVSPCPMIATNTAGDGWTFYQLCSLLRITVDNIPATAKRLEISFDGKNVAGNFAISDPKGDGSSTIALADASGSNSAVITITKDGTDVALGVTSLVANIPLPVGTYSNSKITVNAYDAVSGGDVLSFGNILFSYEAANTKGVKKTTSLTDQSIFTFTFRDADTPNKDKLGGLRFVRLFSCQNKLYNGATTFGPYTVSSDADMANPVQATLKFGPDDGDQLAFQVIDANGKVYSGLYNAPAGGFPMGSYDLPVDVKAYTFTMRSGNSGNKFYFSPGDLGVDNGVYSFTEPFTTWAHGNTTVYTTSPYGPTQRVWFDHQYDDAVITSGTVYGIAGWRSPNRAGSSVDTYEWNYLVKSRTMSDNVARYYKVTIPGHQYCLLLPPDETQSADIGEDLTAGEVTDYAKYIGKGFVLLFNTNRATYSSSSSSKKFSWGGATSNSAKQGFYWAIYNSSNRYYFTWPDNGPKVDWEATRQRDHVRYVRNVQ